MVIRKRSLREMVTSSSSMPGPLQDRVTPAHYPSSLPPAESCVKNERVDSAWAGYQTLTGNSKGMGTVD